MPGIIVAVVSLSLHKTFVAVASLSLHKTLPKEVNKRHVDSVSAVLTLEQRL